MTQVGRLHTRLVLLQDGDDLGMPLALHPPQARDQRGKLSYNWKAKYTNEMRRDRESARANARMKPILNRGNAQNYPILEAHERRGRTALRAFPDTCVLISGCCPEIVIEGLHFVDIPRPRAGGAGREAR